MRSPSVFATSAVILSTLALVLAGETAGATESLASADFTSDSAGSVARNLPGMVVSEEVYDCSSTSSGESEVVVVEGNNVYRVSNVDAGGASKGIRAPLSSSVSIGTLVVEAVVSAGQTGGAGDLCVTGTDDEDWLGRTKFASNGTFTIHTGSTTQPYVAGHRYRVTMTFHFDILSTVDYLVVDLDASETVIDSTGHMVPPAAAASNVIFRACAGSEGAFTIDDLLATN